MLVMPQPPAAAARMLTAPQSPNWHCSYSRVQGGVPGFFRKGGSLTHRLANVKRSATQRPARAGFLVATYGMLAALGISLGGVVLVPQTVGADALADKTSGKGAAAIEEKLKTIHIPSVEFQDTPLRVALAFLQQQSIELDANEPDSKKKGVHFVLQAGDSVDVENVTITLKLSNVPLATALKYTVTLAQLKYEVGPQAAFIVPQAVFIVPLSKPRSDLFTKVYDVTSTFLSAAPRVGGDYTRTASGGPLNRRTARDILKEAGVTFSPGTSAIYVPETSQLVARTTQDKLKLIEAYIKTYETPKELIVGKLGTIIIPSVEFQDTPIREALATLQAKSAEYDPAKKGIKLIFHPNPDRVDSDRMITLKLLNVPLTMAIKYTAALVQMNYQVEADGVHLVPFSTELFTKVYAVPRTLFSAATGDPSQKRTARDILNEAGVTFNPGASAVYNYGTSELIVRNTQDQLKLVEAYIKANKRP